MKENRSGSTPRVVTLARPSHDSLPEFAAFQRRGSPERLSGSFSGPHPGPTLKLKPIQQFVNYLVCRWKLRRQRGGAGEGVAYFGATFTSTTSFARMVTATLAAPVLPTVSARVSGLSTVRAFRSRTCCSVSVLGEPSSR